MDYALVLFRRYDVLRRKSSFSAVLSRLSRRASAYYRKVSLFFFLGRPRWTFSHRGLLLFASPSPSSSSYIKWTRRPAYWSCGTLNKLEGLVRARSIDTPARTRKPETSTTRVALRRHWQLARSLVRLARTSLRMDGPDGSGLKSTKRSLEATQRDFSGQTSFAQAGERERCVGCSPSDSTGPGRKKEAFWQPNERAVSLVPNIKRRGAARRVDNARRSAPVRCCQCNRSFVRPFGPAVFNAGNIYGSLGKYFDARIQRKLRSCVSAKCVAIEINSYGVNGGKFLR